MKHIKNYEDYFVDEAGNVYSKRKGSLKKLKPILTHYGYYEANIVNSERKFRAKIHRLVFEQYLREQNIPCETQEQMENYLKFGRHYFLRLRDKAPRSEDLITYEHK